MWSLSLIRGFTLIYMYIKIWLFPFSISGFCFQLPYIDDFLKLGHKWRCTNWGPSCLSTRLNMEYTSWPLEWVWIIYNYLSWYCNIIQWYACIFIELCHPNFQMDPNFQILLKFFLHNSSLALVFTGECSGVTLPNGSATMMLENPTCIPNQ